MKRRTESPQRNAPPPTETPDAYRAFLETKVRLAPAVGFEIDPAELNPVLKDHIKVVVPWMARLGRCLLASSFGTQKTTAEFELARHIQRHKNARRAKGPHPGPPLIVTSLGARLSFLRDAERWFTGPYAIRIAFIRDDSERDPGAINITNVESVREGKVDPRRYCAVLFDEGDILRNMATKTFWTFTRRAKEIELRCVATATPDPNDYQEILAYAGYLDVMDIGQARTRWFKRDSQKADALTLHKHKEREFWLWVSSWALFFQKPSDLDPSFSDDGYVLPPIDLRWHIVPTNHRQAGAEKSGQLKLIKDSAAGVVDAAREKRDTIEARIAKLMEIRAEEPDEHRLIWHHLEDERRAIERAIGKEEKSSTTKARRARRQKEEQIDSAARSARTDASPTSPSSSSCPSCLDARESARPSEILGGRINVRPGEPSTSIRRYASIFGSQPLAERERILIGFAEGKVKELGAKPVMLSAGGNYQYHCSRMVYLGMDDKFRDFIQGLHRLVRYGQPRPVRVDIILSESERGTRRRTEQRWKQHETQTAMMAGMIREFGLSSLALASALTRSMDVKRQVESGERFEAVHDDCVEHARRIVSNTIKLILTSIPFAGQYEYTKSYRDFGHVDTNAEFWAQMDFLTRELLRILEPGRVLAVHCKDRVVEGSRSGLGFPTISPFGAETIMHYQKHGFAYIGTRFIGTDVVAENFQTNRLGFSEVCKDGTVKGAGLIEYVHLFRKAQSDRSRGYADVPVIKFKREWDRHTSAWTTSVPKNARSTAADLAGPDGPNGQGYSRARWQVDAAGFWRSNGNRLLTPDELASRALSPEDLARTPRNAVFRRWREHSVTSLYDYNHHVACAEAADRAGKLPPDYGVVQAHSVHPDFWTDIARMRSLNSQQARRGREQHLAPLPFDIVERIIDLYSSPGDLVYDPFGGIGTVPYCAIRMGRRSLMSELNPEYFADGVHYCRAAERKADTPTLFDLLDARAGADPSAQTNEPVAQASAEAPAVAAGGAA